MTTRLSSRLKANTEAIVDELMLAADDADIERVDQLLDMLRLRAEYDALVDDLMLATEGDDENRIDRALDLLRAYPTFRSFVAMRATSH